MLHGKARSNESSPTHTVLTDPFDDLENGDVWSARGLSKGGYFKGR